MKKSESITIRVSPSEREAWDADRERRKMEDLSQWVRSACATFLVCGKATVIVPASPEPEYVESLRAEIREVTRVTEELQHRTRVLEKLQAAEARGSAGAAAAQSGSPPRSSISDGARPSAAKTETPG